MSRPPRTSRLVVKSGAVAVVALIAGCVLTACSGSSSDSITLYNGQHEQTTDALVAAFEKQTGITVNVRSDDEDVMANQIIQEGSKSPADVFYTENSPALESLQVKNLLAPVNASTLAQVPNQYNSPQGDWEGVTARVSVMIYNTNVVQPSQLPTSVSQLAQPQWKGKLAIAGGETDFQPIITSYLNTYGHAATVQWLNGMKTNAANHNYPDNETITSMVNSGQASIGIINSYYWYREQVEVGASNMHSAIAFFAPHDPGYVLDVSGAGILKSSKHQADDQKFLAFLSSAQGQQIIAHSDSFEYPIGSGVTTAKPLKPFDQLQPAPLTIGQLGDGAEAIALLQQEQLL